MTSWRITALNVGLPETIVLGGQQVVSAIRKRPVTGAVFLRREGFAGDGVGSTKHHGGPDKAVCVYSDDHYASWNRELGRPLPAAAFGENLTVAGLDEAQVCIGDIWRLGAARVQVTQPRQPCRTLAQRIDQPDLIDRVVRSARCGLYLRVLEEGNVNPTDEVVFLERDPDEVTVARAHRVRHLGEDGSDGLDEVLAVSALSATWRASLQKKRDG